VTQDALINAAKTAGVTLSVADKNRLMSNYLTLDIWPDVLPAIQQILKQGLHAGFLSNMTTEMLTSCMKHAGITQHFDHVISTDVAKTFKPDRKAYQLGVDTLKIKKEQVLFVAFAGWDAAGAKWFGYPTFWMNRLQSTAEELGVTPDGNGKSMSELISFLNG
jgi:2-haloacid dehalogenase